MISELLHLRAVRRELHRGHSDLSPAPLPDASNSTVKVDMCWEPKYRNRVRLVCICGDELGEAGKIPACRPVMGWTCMTSDSLPSHRIPAQADLSIPHQALRLKAVEEPLVTAKMDMRRKAASRDAQASSLADKRPLEVGLQDERFPKRRRDNDSVAPGVAALRPIFSYTQC